MSVIASIVCVNCYQLYDDSRKPCLGTCHDSVCQQCRQEMKVFTCPTCGRKDAFRKEKINWRGMPLQEDILNKFTEDNIEEFIKNQKDKNSGPCQECGDLAKKLRICLDCASGQDVIIPEFDHFTMNLSGVTVLGAFYKAKQFSICANCAMDGKHAEHKWDLFANVYDERMVDMELDFVLKRILKQKYGKEMEKQQSDKKWIYQYEQDIVNIEMNRQRRRAYQSGDVVDSPMRAMHPDIIAQLKEVMEEVALYERKIQMINVEEIQIRHADSEDEEFRRELEGVIERMLTEEEKLGVEEMEKVEEVVKERILKHCEGGNGVEDYEEAGEKVEEARLFMMSTLEESFNAPTDEMTILETDEHGNNTISIGKVLFELNRKFSMAELDYYKALAHETLCDLTRLETERIAMGRGIRVEHPNLEEYLRVFEMVDRQNNSSIEDIQCDSVLHF